MLASDNTQNQSIFIELLLEEQDEIWHSIRDSLSRDSEAVIPSELMYDFFKIARKVVEEMNYYLQLQRSIKGFKFGYERKIIHADGSYTIESNFISDQDWRVIFDTRLKNQVHFLTELDKEPQPLQDTDEIYQRILQDPSKVYLRCLTDRLADELYRIYPKLLECFEIHVYVLAHFVGESFDSEDRNSDAEDLRRRPDLIDSINRVTTLNLINNSLLTRGGILSNDLELGEELTIGARNCPGCDDGINKYDKGRGTMQGTVCSAC